MCTSEPRKQKFSKEVEDQMRKNAIRYERYKDQLDNIPVAELNEFRYEVEFAFDRIQRKHMHTGACIPGANNGIHERMFISFVDYDPYENLIQLTNDIHENDRLLISSLHNDSKLMPGDLNLKFRAVHDFLHYILQQPFDYLGEYKVFQAQKHIHKSKLRRQILYSEVVLQAAYCEYFGKFVDNQKIVLL